MASLECYIRVIKIRNELKKKLKGKLTKELSVFIEDYPLYLSDLLNKYGAESTVSGFKEAYSKNNPSFSDIQNAVKKYFIAKENKP